MKNCLATRSNRVPEKLWMNIVQEAVIKTISKKKKCKKAKCLSEALQIAEKRKDAKGKGEKIYSSEYRVL